MLKVIFILTKIAIEEIIGKLILSERINKQFDPKLDLFPFPPPNRTLFVYCNIY